MNCAAVHLLRASASILRWTKPEFENTNIRSLLKQPAILRKSYNEGQRCRARSAGSSRARLLPLCSCGEVPLQIHRPGEPTASLGGVFCGRPVPCTRLDIVSKAPSPSAVSPVKVTSVVRSALERLFLLLEYSRMNAYGFTVRDKSNEGKA